MSEVDLPLLRSIWLTLLYSFGCLVLLFLTSASYDLATLNRLCFIAVCGVFVSLILLPLWLSLRLKRHLLQTFTMLLVFNVLGSMLLYRWSKNWLNSSE